LKFSLIEVLKMRLDATGFESILNAIQVGMAAFLCIFRDKTQIQASTGRLIQWDSHGLEG
jgi:hypothetical protein